MAKSSAEAAVLAPSEAKQALIVVCSSPKGGAGKGTISQAVAVGAAMDGHKVLILDYDPQKSTLNWTKRRAAIEGVAAIEGRAGTWGGVKQELRDAAASYDVVVVDTPTAVEEHIREVDAMVRAASYVLIPTGPQYVDRESVRPWMTVIRGLTKNVAFVLNRVNRQTRSLRDAKADLVAVGKLCPIEVGLYEDIHMVVEQGLSVVEIGDAKGHSDLGAVWNFVKSELGV